MRLLELLIVSLISSVSAFLRSGRVQRNSLSRIHSIAAKDQLVRILEGSGNENVLVCPETLCGVNKQTRWYGFVEETFYVSRDFGTKYPSVSKGYIDFTIGAEVNRPLWQRSIKETFFQNPFISSIYERGYRQNFQLAGFPGIEAEYVEAYDLFTTYFNASIVLDLSCGSGFMTRRFAKSGRFPQVIAADLSPTMLAETRRRCLEEGIDSPLLVRCDSARLPFRTGSISAIHAGAAMHCWPRLSQSLAEIYRVLQPGGRFYASTFFDNAAYPTGNNRPFYFFKSESELTDMLTQAGFSGGDAGENLVRREGRACAIVKAIKGPLPPSTAQVDDDGKKLRAIFTKR